LRWERYRRTVNLRMHWELLLSMREVCEDWSGERVLLQSQKLWVFWNFDKNDFYIFSNCTAVKGKKRNWTTVTVRNGRTEGWMRLLGKKDFCESDWRWNGASSRK
jgi:hypothetical protein